jgi:ATP-dependent RNA helicase DDX52/ROK1
MELFAALRGGAKFDRKKFGAEMARFSKNSSNNSSVVAKASVDFFKKDDNSAGAKRKRENNAGNAKASVSKKSKAIEKSAPKQKRSDDDRNDEDDDEQSSHSADEQEEEEEEEDNDDGVRILSSQPAIKSGSSKIGGKNSVPNSKNVRESSAAAARREEIATFRKSMRITVTGDNVPNPVGSFDEMQLPGAWLRNGIEQAGWKEPTPIQMQAIPALLAGMDVVACAPTGSGKTGAFVIPMYAMLKAPEKSGARGLIVSPTRELAVQIHQQCDRLRSSCKIRVRLLTKATSASISASQNTQDVIVSTPARLVALLASNGVDLSSVKMVIIDEADKLFDQGFVTQIDEVLAACTNPKLQKALFSATMPPAVEQLARSIMPHPVFVTIGGKVAASHSVKQKLVFVGSEEGKVLAMRQLVQQGLKPPVLVFVQSIDRAKQLFRELIFDGINVDVMHADRTQVRVCLYLCSCCISVR